MKYRTTVWISPLVQQIELYVCHHWKEEKMKKKERKRKQID